jgi:hypothetical protein
MTIDCWLAKLWRDFAVTKAAAKLRASNILSKRKRGINSQLKEANMKLKEARELVRSMRQSTAARKRGADWTEKFSIAALVIGLFQAETPFVGAISIILAAIAGISSFWLTLKLEKEGK